MVPVNYLAIALAAVAAMVVGFLWYGPLFGKKWSDLMGFGEMTPERMQDMQKKARPGYALTFVASLLMAYVLAHNIIFASSYLKVSGLAAGAQAAFWTWLGFIVPVTLGQILWENRPRMLWLINVSYWLVNLLVMSIILSVWE